MQGKAELLVKKPFKVSNLDLMLEGLEETEWWFHTDKIHIPYRGNRKIIDQRIPLVSFFGNELALGSHKVDFNFQLPPTLPGAFLWYHLDWKAKIEYKLKLQLTALDEKDNLEFERFILIQEKNIPAKEETKDVEVDHKIKTMGMFSKGRSKYKV